MTCSGHWIRSRPIDHYEHGSWWRPGTISFTVCVRSGSAPMHHSIKSWSRVFAPPRQFAIDDPALQLIDEETLRTILDELNTNLRDVLMLIGEGYSIKEIAQMLDIDYPAARKRTSRAMRYVRERYTELGVFPKEPR